MTVASHIDERGARMPPTLLLKAALALVGAKARLLRRDFAHALAWADRGPRSHFMSASDEHTLVHSLAHAVPAVAAFMPTRMRCLEQALALQCLLRRRGIESELLLGVTPFRFEAHAWVEWHGAPLNENGELIRKLLPLRNLTVERIG
jgi:hypothetical protein